MPLGKDYRMPGARRTVLYVLYDARQLSAAVHGRRLLLRAFTSESSLAVIAVACLADRRRMAASSRGRPALTIRARIHVGPPFADWRVILSNSWVRYGKNGSRTATGHKALKEKTWLLIDW